MKELARHAVQLGGTVSAEHGLGKRKAYLLELPIRARADCGDEKRETAARSELASRSEHALSDR